MKARLALIAAALAAPALAQPGQTPAPPVIMPTAPLDAEAVAAARELLVAVNFDTRLEETARLNTQATFGTFLRAMEEQQGSEFPEGLELQLRGILADHLEEALAEVLETALDESAQIYARYFTAAEIRELQRLQSHPVMVKYQRIAPAFMTELSQVGLPAMARRMPELEQRMRDAVEAWARSAVNAASPTT